MSLTKTIRKSYFSKMLSMIFVSNMLFQSLASLPPASRIYIPFFKLGQDSATVPTNEWQK